MALLCLALLCAAPARALDASGPAPAGPVSSAASAAVTGDDADWARVQPWIAAAPDVQALPVEGERAEATLQRLRIAPQSTLGALVRHVGGLLIDHGWLRVRGAGSARMRRALADAGDGLASKDASGRPTLLLVADDVLGGVFAIDQGALGEDRGKVVYLAPDTLRWEPLGLDYDAFLAWSLSARVPQFYRSQRWPGWEAEVGRLDADQALSVRPYLWAEGPPIWTRTRKPVPAAQLLRETLAMRRQVAP